MTRGNYCRWTNRISDFQLKSLYFSTLTTAIKEKREWERKRGKSVLDKISHSKTNSCQPYEGESRIPEFPDRSTSAVLCKALSPSLSASANDTAGQETLKLTTSSLFSLKEPCQAAQHPISLPKTLSLSLSLSTPSQLICYTRCPASCTQLPSHKV